MRSRASGGESGRRLGSSESRAPARSPAATVCSTVVASGSPNPMLEPETWIQLASPAARAAASASIASAAEPRTEKKKSRPPLLS